MEKNDLVRATEELLAHSAEDVVFEPHAAHGHELREFWSRFEEEGLQMRAGAYSIIEEGDSVIVSGWVRTIDEGRLADTQASWVYRFDAHDRVVSARVERT
jgi:hypothetical protein